MTKEEIIEKAHEGVKKSFPQMSQDEMDLCSTIAFVLLDFANHSEGRKTFAIALAQREPKLILNFIKIAVDPIAYQSILARSALVLARAIELIVEAQPTPEGGPPQ